MCDCSVGLIITRYEDEGYQMEQCPACGDCEPEPLELTAEEAAAFDALMEGIECPY